MVVGKEAFMKRAESAPGYDGIDAGIIVTTGDAITYRKGTLKLPGEEILGGYAEVYRKDRSHPYRIEVSFEEYAGRKNDGSLNRQWSKKPATMIRKVALVQALREAFPDNFSGLYSEEEVENGDGVFEPPVIPAETRPEIPQQNPTVADVTGQMQGAADPTAAFFN